jgi:hypothetical protein
MAGTKEKVRIKDAPSTYRSSVWKYFGFGIDEATGVVKNDKTICKLCYMELKYVSTTTNMRKHLDIHHPSVTSSSTPEKVAPSKTVRTISDAFAAPYSINSARAQTITKEIGIFLAVDMRPYCLVDTIAFKKMISALDHKYKIPSRTYFSETVHPMLYEETRTEVVSKLKSTEAIAVTTDGWTSR